MRGDVLRTMTPSGYTQFRDNLGTSSDFQSKQCRLIEFMLRNRKLAMMKMHEHRPELYNMLEQELQIKSLYQVVRDLLSKATNTIFSATVYSIDTPHLANDAAMSAWVEVYQDPQKYWALYELAEKLVDLEDYFRRWRFNHVTTVERDHWIQAWHWRHIRCEIPAPYVRSRTISQTLEPQGYFCNCSLRTKPQIVISI